MPTIDSIAAGDTLPERDHFATNVSLFMYNAAVWNAHRIHYDERYATEEEHHRGVVIDGPLQGDWLTQVVIDWLGEDGSLVEFEYSNRRASMLGETLTAGGAIADIQGATVTLTLFIRNENGEITTPGRAVVELHN